MCSGDFPGAPKQRGQRLFRNEVFQSQSGEYAFRRKVADPVVLGEWTAAEPSERGVEPAAAGVIGGPNHFCRVFGAPVKMDADFELREAAGYFAEDFRCLALL